MSAGTRALLCFLCFAGTPLVTSTPGIHLLQPYNGSYPLINQTELTILLLQARLW